MTRVGFIGLGSQGGPMARRIIDARYPTTLWARHPATLEPFAGTAAGVAASRAELGASCDVLCICVVDDEGVDEVLRSADGVLASMAVGSSRTKCMARLKRFSLSSAWMGKNGRTSISLTGPEQV